MQLASVNLPRSLTAYKQEHAGGGIPMDLWGRVEAIQNSNRMSQLKMDLWKFGWMENIKKSASLAITQARNLASDRSLGKSTALWTSINLGTVSKTLYHSLITPSGLNLRRMKTEKLMDALRKLPSEKLMDLLRKSPSDGFFGLCYAMDGVIRDETLIEKDIDAIFVNCFRSRTN